MPISTWKLKGITIGDTQIEIPQPFVWVKIDTLRIDFVLHLKSLKTTQG
jgi:hypothetical protein